MRTLKQNANRESDPVIKHQKMQWYKTYKGMVQPEGHTWHDKPHHAIEEMLCKPIDDIGHHHFRCVLGKCRNCPEFPIPQEEKDKSDDAPTISFHHYVPATKCMKHGDIELRAKECQKCCELPNGSKKGKISMHKELTLLHRPISEFIEEYYIPGLKKYAYHQSHIKILSKQEGQCRCMQKEQFLHDPGSTVRI